MHIRNFVDEHGIRSDYLVGNDDGGSAAFMLLGSNGPPVLGAQQESPTTVRVVSAYMPRLSDAITLAGTVDEVLDLIAPQPADEPEEPPAEPEVPEDPPAEPETPEEPETPPVEEETVPNGDTSTEES